MVAKLLKRLAGRSSSTSGDGETLARQNPGPGVEREDRTGAVGYPLPSAWVKMHVWRRDHGRCVLCRGQESVWFDYILPPWKGGSVTEQNIRLMCESCERDHRHNRSMRVRRNRWRD
jgi:hypothetical protein